jgi:hypothetical protein
MAWVKQVYPEHLRQLAGLGNEKPSNLLLGFFESAISKRDRVNAQKIHAQCNAKSGMDFRAIAVRIRIGI